MRSSQTEGLILHLNSYQNYTKCFIHQLQISPHCPQTDGLVEWSTFLLEWGYQTRSSQTKGLTLHLNSYQNYTKCFTFISYEQVLPSANQWTCRTVKSILKNGATSEGKHWDKMLPYLLLAYRGVSGIHGVFCV